MTGTKLAMTPERWDQVKKIFDAVMESPVTDRQRVLLNLCAGDSQLQSEISSLLAAEENAGSFLNVAAEMSCVAVDRNAYGHSLEGRPLIADRFEIRRFIGSGGMGEVYEAWDRELQQQVALKTLRPDIALYPGTLMRFKAEVKESLRITNPNVCRVYQLASSSAGRDPTIWFLTMELLDGQTVAQYLTENGPIEYRHAYELIKQMVSGLSSAHQAGIVHRDLKPGNLMIVGSGSSQRLVITDFGLAVSFSSAQTGGMAGTPAYMAPEQLTGGAIGPSADIYALGLIVCEMLTGKRPTLMVNGANSYRRQLSAWLSANPGVPRRMRAIVERCLQFSPEDRFQDAGQITPLLEGKRKAKLERAVASIIVFAAVASVVVILAPQMSERIETGNQLTPMNSVSAEASLSADGRYLAYMSNQLDQEGSDAKHMEIWLQQMPTGTAVRLTHNSGENTSPSISPDGKLVAFRSERSGGGIYLVGSDGTNERLAIPGGRNPSFSPDGRFIAYWEGPEDTWLSGGIYRYEVATGVTRRLAPEFIDARYPTWNAGGRLLFVGCKAARDDLTCPDWWELDVSTNESISTGIFPLLRKSKVNSDFPPHLSWIGDHLLLAGRTDRTFHLWDVHMTGGSSPHAVGDPKQLTFGELDEQAPVLGPNGQIVMEHTYGTLHLSRINLSEAVDAVSHNITDKTEPDCCPMVSANLRWLFFTRRIDGILQLMKLDTVSGREYSVYSSREDKLSPLPDMNGQAVAFESRRGAHSSILLWDGKAARLLCSECSHPSAWVSEDKQLVYTTAKGDTAELDIVTGASHRIAASSPYVLSDPDWNTKTEYLLVARSLGAHQQLVAGKYIPSSNSKVERWFAVTSQTENADLGRWSEDGKTVYYFSHADGYYCLWRNSFDPATGRIGRATIVKHYHNWGESPSRTFRYDLGLSVAGPNLYTNIGNVSDILWDGTLREHALARLWRELIYH